MLDLHLLNTTISTFLTISAMIDFMLAHWLENVMASIIVIDWYTSQPNGFAVSNISAGSHIPLYSTITTQGSYCLSNSLSFSSVKSSFSRTTIDTPLSFNIFSSYSSSPSSHTISSLFFASSNCPISIVSEIKLVLPLSSWPLIKNTGIWYCSSCAIYIYRLIPFFVEISNSNILTNTSKSYTFIIFNNKCDRFTWYY